MGEYRILIGPRLWPRSYCGYPHRAWPPLQGLDVDRLLDAGCGDFYWLRAAGLPVREYVGVDVVPELIDEVSDRYTAPGRTFLRADITRDPLQSTDVVLCREVLTHFPDRDVLAAVSNMKRTRAQWLLTTTFVPRPSNEEIVEE